MTASDKINRLPTISALEIILGLMACLSLALIFTPREWVETSLEFIPSDYQAVLSDDTYSDGDSKASWISAEQQSWQCVMGQKYIAPYCSMRIAVMDDGWTGLDLSRFSQMTLWANYQGPAESIRIYLRNRHPNYYQAGDDTSTKYNLVEIAVSELEKGFTLNMKDFSVADWWLATKMIPLADSHPEFNDVVFVELQTGSQARSGTHHIQLHKIVWRGALVSDETLYKGMVICWSVLIFSLLLYRMITLKFELSRNLKHQQELIAINKLLNLQNKQFEDLAKTDQLTGLLNRIGIRDALYDGLNNWKEKRTALSFVLIDIDHFKSINDTYGHDEGDRILQATASLLAANIRSTDYLARWGGEEFMLVCPNTDLHQAQQLAELLRQKLQHAELHPERNITASFGVASLSEANLDELFRRADHALYEAKEQGRNRVCTLPAS